MRNLFRPLAILLAVLMSLHGIAYAFELTPSATPAVRDALRSRLSCKPLQRRATGGGQAG
ncbi:hypothetical protein KQH60_10185 [Mycetohabitans sp. B8]|uniref:hypothetical protein n=1 Tax=Mycetohabitans sp. B8 TaxID=2841845 RepID=UPI001F180B50|nr:hypothetical protein [Mycetohabitans sp. B8]MCG1042883.1 hypothetical protein [Mycetohabitans sp. B8]